MLVHHIVQPEQQLLPRPELQVEHILLLPELVSMLQPVQLILQPVHLELIQLLIHSQLVHVVIQQQLQ